MPVIIFLKPLVGPESPTFARILAPICIFPVKTLNGLASATPILLLKPSLNQSAESLFLNLSSPKSFLAPLFLNPLIFENSGNTSIVAKNLDIPIAYLPVVESNVVSRVRISLPFSPTTNSGMKRPLFINDLEDILSIEKFAPS